MVRFAAQGQGIAPLTMIMSLYVPQCKPKWVLWQRAILAHKEVCKKVPTMTNTTNPTKVTMRINLMITSNKIRDKTSNRVRWLNRITAYLREIAGRAALGTSWMQTIILPGYLYRSVVLQQTGIRAPEPRMLLQTWPQERKEVTSVTFRWAKHEARDHKVIILLGMQAVCRARCKIDRICLVATRSLLCSTKPIN